MKENTTYWAIFGDFQSTPASFLRRTGDDPPESSIDGKVWEEDYDKYARRLMTGDNSTFKLTPEEVAKFLPNE